MQFLKTTWTISTRKESLAELTSGIQVPEYTCVVFCLGICLPTSPSCSHTKGSSSWPFLAILFSWNPLLVLPYLAHAYSSFGSQVRAASSRESPWLPQVNEMLPPCSQGTLPHPTTCRRSPPTSSPVCLPNNLLTGLALQGAGASNQAIRCYAHSYGHQDIEGASPADAIRQTTFSFCPCPRLCHL